MILMLIFWGRTSESAQKLKNMKETREKVVHNQKLREEVSFIVHSMGT